MIQMLIEKFTFQITHAVRAVGKIRNFQIVESIACLAYLPIAYLLFKSGWSAEWIYWLAIADGLLVAAVRLYYGKTIAGMNVLQYIMSAIIPILLPLAISALVCVAVSMFVGASILRVFLNTVLFCSIFTALFFILSMNQEERWKWKGLITSFVK